MGKRKPDLIAKKESRILVIDAQVVGESVDLRKANTRKISYYRDNHELDDCIQKHGTSDINYCSATLNLRGVWSERSASDLGGQVQGTQPLGPPSDQHQSACWHLRPVYNVYQVNCPCHGTLLLETLPSPLSSNAVLSPS
ncbi:hypothetical protein AVEN_205825-1 [Araneus ventricosus]|uniref:Uncharacterized protein n=1 Tax=Araneus ventricosus TaxID=182803 RepID=A0A4Y2E435_ARAVE|nr:hypothetical protein AVEN_205825-1 [Araneus ventricosus]